MKTLTFKDFLIKHKACEDGLEYVESLDWNFDRFYAECKRADWMIWLLERTTGFSGFPSEDEVILMGCDIAEDVLPVYEAKYPDDDRPRKAIRARRDYVAGKIGLEELAAARAARAAAKPHNNHADMIRGEFPNLKWPTT